MRLVTSFHDEGYDLYGKKFLESFIEHWDIPLTVYYEIKRDFPVDNRITYKPLFELERLTDYLSREKIQVISVINNWKFNLFKFCRKAFIQAEEMKYEPFFWIDADVVIDRKPDIDLTDLLGDSLVAYMKRINYHPCTSLVGFNTKHPEMPEFRHGYINQYLTDDVLTYPEWHDAYVFGRYVNSYVNSKTIYAGNYIDVKNLCWNIPNEDKGFASNVFNLVLPFARHNKGNLKYEDRVLPM